MIDIEHLDDKDGYDRLILRPGHKETVKALVEQHFEARESLNDKEQVDLVRGKGKGLIILLHGAPGVGKTSTAGELNPQILTDCSSNFEQSVADLE